MVTPAVDYFALGITMLELFLGEKPFKGVKAAKRDVYLFCNRGRKLLKALWWDRNGFRLSQKRLEKDKFP